MPRKETRTRRQFLGTAAAGALGAMLAGPSASEAQTPQKRFRVVDTHVHLHNHPERNVEHQLSLMDNGGVDRAFLISYNAYDIQPQLRAGGGSPLTRVPVINRQYQITAWKAHKDRFWWFPDHIDPMNESMIEDLERYVEMGASGFKLLSLFHGFLPDNPGFQPVYELCRRRKKPMIVDLSWWYMGRFGWDNRSPDIGYGFNETKERQQMVQGWKNFGEYAATLDPIFKEYSTVPFSLAHCGTAKAKEDYEHIFALLARHPNLSCDLAMILDFSPHFFEDLTRAVGAHKVMYGTDAPYWFKGVDSYRTGRQRWTMIADDCPFLSDAEKQMILAGNAERFARSELPQRA